MIDNPEIQIVPVFKQSKLDWAETLLTDTTSPPLVPYYEDNNFSGPSVLDDIKCNPWITYIFRAE